MMHKLHHLLRCYTTGINSSLIFLECFAFFKYITPSQKSDMNNIIRINYIKIIILIKIKPTAVMSLTCNKWDFIKIFIVKEYSL